MRIVTVKANGNKTIISATSMFRSTLRDVEVDMPFDEFVKAYSKLSNGVLIQDAFPTLNRDEREFILSGMTKQEWDDMFKEKE